MSDAHETCTECLYDQLYDRLLLFVARRVNDQADADDIVQDIFLRIHTHLDQVREMEKLEAWVFQVARNAITDAYRRRKVTAELGEIAVEDSRPEPEASEELAGYLGGLVNELAEPYREALILTEFRGISQKELAQQLGISLSGAKSRVQRARMKVKESLLACCHVGFDRRGLICCYRPCCPCCDESRDGWR